MPSQRISGLAPQHYHFPSKRKRFDSQLPNHTSKHRVFARGVVAQFPPHTKQQAEKHPERLHGAQVGPVDSFLSFRFLCRQLGLECAPSASHPP